MRFIIWRSDDVWACELRHSEMVFPSSSMPVSERCVLPDIIVLYIFKTVEGDPVNWRSLRERYE